MIPVLLYDRISKFQARMRTTIAVLLVSALAVAAFAAPAKVAVRYNATLKSFSVESDETFGPIAANVSTDYTFTTTGWDVVIAEGNDDFMAVSEENRLNGYRAAGYGEGYLNAARIYQNFANSFNGDQGVTAMLLSSPQIVPWIDRHIAYLQERSLVTDDIGRMLGGMLALIDGISLGYNVANVDPAKAINATQFFWLSFQAEVGDIITAYSTEDDIQLWKAMPKLDPRRPSRHCSALVKVLPTDLYFSHDTWSSFNSMMRQYKTYRFEGRAVSMSGYPAVVHSIDDWYMTSNRLAVMETTNGVYNNSLFREYVQNGTNTISEFLRVMIANFLAPSSPSWVTYFSTENSGTYNNQWMVFDMKKFTPGSPIPADTFWVAEQLPGNAFPYGVTSADKTDVLNTETYWASYNLPYFTNVYDVSGNLEQYVLYGDFYSYTNYSRAEIFRRNHSDVVDLDSMKAMMRYNNFEHDPFSLISNCKDATGGVCDPKYSAMLSIASRGDLNPPGGESKYGINYGFLSQRDHCATDTKIAVWSMMMNNTEGADVFTGVVINGPTSYQQPVFRWDTSPFYNNTNILRAGLPNVYDFPFAEVSYAYPAAITPTASTDDNKHAVAIGLGVAGGVVVLAVLVGLVIKSRSGSVDHGEQVNLMERETERV